MNYQKKQSSKQHYKQAEEVEKIKKDINYKYVKENFEFTMIRNTAMYMHEYTVNCSYIDEAYDYTDNTDKQEELAEKVSKIIDEVKNNICREIYDELDEAYMHMISDESIEELLELDDYEYTQDGIEWY